MGQALYRTYRSRALSEVVGQEHITATLARAIAAGRISHAYLFTGPRGTGKTSVARILAHEINQLPYADTPHLDIVEIDAASNRRIDDIRDLREKVHIAPVSAKYKVYIIDEVHMLTGESFNALLKTLEEPPSHVVFILATTEAHKLPATIISRTQRFAFRPGSKEKVTAHLKMIAKKEKITIDDGALQLIAEHGEGSFRDSLSLLDQLTHITAGAITADDVVATLGLARADQIAALITAIKTRDHKTILDTLAALEAQGSNAGAVVDQLTKTLLAEAGENPDVLPLIDALLDVPRAYNPQLKLIATLAIFAPASAPQAPPKTFATPVSSPPKTIAEIAPAPKKITAPPPKEVPNLPAPTTIAPESPLASIHPEDWNQILATLKTSNPPLFAIVKHAQPEAENNGLVLRFKFGLLAKKLEDPKQKSALAEVVQQVLGGTYAMTVLVDKNATPPPITSNPHVKTVTSIMGGGELIDAPAL